ncbi:GtrA family protein [Pseudomonas lundensis]|uniref:GtrA family protein n=1 Tax=Serratia proteamaculans TaxID=28151 RepID=UPI0029819EC1|nr:GtrA family protein [Serratia proteamaculans]MDW5500238.1 GtrA family protein [Serratia proteamaculans]MDW5505304.1 GtrA family protein [Pseudomonas lundensis]
MKKTIIELVKFGFVGIVGFLVDAAIVLFLYEHLGVYGARVISFTCAVVTTWLLNRTFTFKGHSHSSGLFNEFIKYFLSMCVGGGANLLCYSLMVSLSSSDSQDILIATAIGSIVGMVFNFTLSKLLIFKER